MPSRISTKSNSLIFSDSCRGSDFKNLTACSARSLRFASGHTVLPSLFLAGSGSTAELFSGATFGLKTSGPGCGIIVVAGIGTGPVCCGRLCWGFTAGESCSFRFAYENRTRRAAGNLPRSGRPSGLSSTTTVYPLNPFGISGIHCRYAEFGRWAALLGWTAACVEDCTAC